MQFVSLIASTLLIVLFSQDLTLGLPVNNTTVQTSCSEGFELIEGNCTKVDSTSNVPEVEFSTVPTEETPAHQGKSVTQSVSSEKIVPCPAGMGRGKDGLCREMTPNQTLEVTPQLPVELTTELNAHRTIESTTGSDTELTTEVTGINEASSNGKSLNSCPRGTQRNKQGVCKPLKSFKIIKVTTQSMNDLTTEFPTDMTTEFASNLTTELPTDLTTELASDLTTELVNDLTTESVVGLTTESVNGLTTELPTDLTTELVNGLTTELVNGLTTESVDGLTTELVNGLTTESVDGLTTESVDGLTTELISDLTTESETDLTTELSPKEAADVDTTTIRGKTLKNCSSGLKRNKQGVCKRIRSSKIVEAITQSMDDLTTELPTDLTTESEVELTTELNTEETTDVDTTTVRGKTLKNCPEGMKRNKQGVCNSLRSSKVTKTTTPSSDDLTTELNAESEIELTTETDAELTTELNTEENAEVDSTTNSGRTLKNCPGGMKRNKQGVCKQSSTSKVVEDNTPQVDDITTESIPEVTEVSNQKEDVNACPEGTVVDEQGACQKIKSANPNKAATDLKALLKKDGSCPDNYKMIKGHCLYIKSKISSTSSPINSQPNDYIPVAIRPKSGTVNNYQAESVPVLSDNSCPEGTEYSEYGLCQKRVGLPESNRLVPVNGRCQDNYKLFNGQCLPTIIKTQVKLQSTTPVADLAESTTTVKTATEGSDME